MRFRLIFVCTQLKLLTLARIDGAHCTLVAILELWIMFKVQAACLSRKHRTNRLCADWIVYNEVALERNSIRVLQRNRLTIIYAFNWRALCLSMQQYNSGAIACCGIHRNERCFRSLCVYAVVYLQWLGVFSCPIHYRRNYRQINWIIYRVNTQKTLIWLSLPRTSTRTECSPCFVCVFCGNRVWNRKKLQARKSILIELHCLRHCFGRVLG